MARLVRDRQLESRSARDTLKRRKAPYWRSLEPGLALGYYKGKTGGAWLARRALEQKKYETRRLGLADDRIDADSGTVLSYADAIAAAREWWLAAKRARHAEKSVRENYTVNDALDAYLADLAARGGRDLKGNRRKAEVHIRPRLGTDLVAALTARRLSEFQTALAEQPRLGRSGKPVNMKKPVEARARRASANRIMTLLRAALNLAYRDGHAERDDAWRRVRPFAKTDQARVRYLSPPEIARLDRVLPEDFRALFRAAIVTGARYSELARLRAGEVDMAAATLLLRETKNGKSRHVFLNQQGLAHFASQIAGKGSETLVFLRKNGKPWKTSEQARPLRRACEEAGIFPAISFHDLRHTFAVLLVRSGVPSRVIADALGHSDTRITEKHYAHLAPSYVAETIRSGMPRLVFESETRSTGCNSELR